MGVNHNEHARSEGARPSDPGCLSGGGEMGERMRAFDWAATPLGPVTSWPQSLRTAISMMLEARFAMVVAWGPEFRFFYNDRYRPMIGAKHPDALGKTGAEIFPEIWEVVGPEFARVARGESVALDDWYLVLERNGYRENCWFSVSYSPIRDEAGQVGGLLAIVVETTARVEMERRLATLRELAAQATEARTPDEACAMAARVLDANPIDVPFAIVYLFDGNGRVARRAAQAGLRAGVPDTIDLESDLAGPVVVDDLAVRFGEPPAAATEPTRAAIVLPLVRAGHAPLGMLVAGISPRRALDDHYRAFFELAAGHIATAISNARTVADLVDARWRAEQAAADEVRARRELARIVEYNEKFTAMLGHDLRNPLNAISTAAQLLERRATGDEIARPAKRIVFSVERMSRMIAQLLDLARVRVMGGLQLQIKPLDLRELCQLVLDELRQATPGAQIALEAAGSLLGRWDADRLAQVLSNLAGNALEHGVPGTPVRVELDGRALDRVAIRVENRGPIADDVLPTLFDPFRGARHRRESTRGLGLGLYISKEIVAAHGGTIEVQSSREAGTRFAIELPRDMGRAR